MYRSLYGSSAGKKISFEVPRTYSTYEYKGEKENFEPPPRFGTHKSMKPVQVYTYIYVHASPSKELSTLQVQVVLSCTVYAACPFYFYILFTLKCFYTLNVVLLCCDTLKKKMMFRTTVKKQNLNM